MDGTALYTYAGCNPIVYCDPNGTASETDDLLKTIRKLFAAHLKLVETIFDIPTHKGTAGAWLTEGVIKDLFGAEAAGNVPYSKSSRVSVDVKIPGTRTAADLKKSEKAIGSKQAIRQTANAKATKDILAKVMPNKIKKEDYSGGLTKRQRETSSKAAQKIRDWKADAPARRKLLPAPNSQGGRGGQRGLVRMGLMGLHPKSNGLADEGELGFMKSVEAQFEKIVVAKAKGAGEQTANLAIDPFHLSAGQTGVVKAQDSLGVAEEGFCHGLELADSAGGGFCGPFAQEGPGFTPISSCCQSSPSSSLSRYAHWRG